METVFLRKLDNRNCDHNYCLTTWELIWKYARRSALKLCQLMSARANHLLIGLLSLVPGPTT